MVTSGETPGRELQVAAVGDGESMRSIAPGFEDMHVAGEVRVDAALLVDGGDPTLKGCGWFCQSRGVSSPRAGDLLLVGISSTVRRGGCGACRSKSPGHAGCAASVTPSTASGESRAKLWRRSSADHLHAPSLKFIRWSRRRCS